MFRPGVHGTFRASRDSILAMDNTKLKIADTKKTNATSKVIGIEARWSMKRNKARLSRMMMTRMTEKATRGLERQM